MTGRLTWRQVEAFRAVMLRGSISGAAQMMNVTQPAVSRLVRDMEQGLGIQLFSRQGGQVVPNAEAVLLQQEVALSFISLGRIERTAEDLRRARRGSLRISAMAGPALTFLPRLLTRFAADHPDTFLSISNNVSTLTLERVSLRQYDFGITYFQQGYPGVDLERLPGLEGLCALPAGHPLADHDVVRLQDLDGEKLLSLGADSPMGQQLEAMLRLAGLGVHVVAEATASDVLCSLAAEGMGLALVDPFTGAAARHPGLRVRRFAPSIAYDIALAFPAGQARSRPLERLVRLIKDEASMSTLMMRP